MKTKTKIALFVIPSILIFILLINLLYGAFIRNFILQQEDSQLGSTKSTVASYMNEKENKYTGTVNDWAHWDDTYYFLQGKNDKYIQDNLMSSTFENLDINFVIYTDNKDSVLYRRFYDFYESKIASFPENFFDGFDDIISFSNLSENTFGIFQIAGMYYFIAATDVTNSLETQPKNGRMYIGRQIDTEMISALGSITDSNILSIAPVNLSGDTSTQSNELSLLNVNRNDDILTFDILYPNEYDLAYSVQITFEAPRTFYTQSIKEAYVFIIHSTFGLILICFILFYVLSKYLTKPFSQLIHDVKKINTSEENLAKLPESGKDEFTYLRKSINHLLCVIEKDRESLLNSREKLQATLLSVGDGVITVGIDQKIEFMNPVAEKLTGWRLNDAIHMPIEIIFNIINEYTRTQVKSPVEEAFEKNEIVELKNHTLLVSKDGTERSIEDTAAPITDKNGEIIGCVLVFRDFSEHKAKQRKIEYLSYHDQLTDLYNRRFFDEELKRLDVKRNLPISFIYADIDGLKIINDAFGHQKGDRLIQKIASIFKAECRSDDIIARTGGDEFIILLPATDAQAVKKLVERLEKRINQIKFMNIHITVSFGWETKAEAEQSTKMLLKSAEDLMYRAKILNSTGQKNEIVKTIIRTLNIKCPREEAHSLRVGELCESIGKVYGLDKHKIDELRIAGELHDIGKITIDTVVLNKTKKLSESEWAQIKQHPETGYRILSATNEFNNISEYVLAHHERWDGSGYPKGLRGEDINWNARVIAVADAYDAMTAERPYRGKALTKEEAIRELLKSAGTQLDPEIVKVFIEKVLNEDQDKP